MKMIQLPQESTQVGFLHKAWIVFFLSTLILPVSIFGRHGPDPRLKRCPPTAPRSAFLKAAPHWDTCYEFRLERRTWRSAHITCLEKKGRMVTIREKRIQRFLIDTMYGMRFGPRRIWIGATDRAKEMKWVWVTGEDVDSGFTSWARGQPSCGITCVEDCAVMNWKEAGGRWHDYHCSWFDSLPYICEYDMIPEPKTTTTTTTTTSTTTTSTTPKTSTIPPMTTRALESEYLVHGGAREEHKENTTMVLVPAQVVLGSNSARVGTVKEETHSSGLSSESLALLIIGILMGLSTGLCLFVFVLIRRRRRNKQREVDPAVSYSNPYYGEVTKKVLDTDDPSSDRGHLLGPGQDEPGEEDSPGIASGATAASPGVAVKTGEWTSGKIKEYTEEEEMVHGIMGCRGGRGGGKALKIPPPPSPLHRRPKYVMNTYDSPPGLSVKAEAGVKKEKIVVRNEDGVAGSSKGNRPRKDLSKHSALRPPPRSLKTRSINNLDGNDYGCAFDAAGENHYDEVGAQNFIPPPPPMPPSSRPPVPPLPASYDVPGSARKHSASRPEQLRRSDTALPATTQVTKDRSNNAYSNSGATFIPAVSSPDNENSTGSMYANFGQEENVYESVENLRAAIERQSRSDTKADGDAATFGYDDDDDGDEAAMAFRGGYTANFGDGGDDGEERYVPFPGDDTYKAMR